MKQQLFRHNGDTCLSDFILVAEFIMLLERIWAVWVWGRMACVKLVHKPDSELLFAILYHWIVRVIHSSPDNYITTNLRFNILLLIVASVDNSLIDIITEKLLLSNEALSAYYYCFCIKRTPFLLMCFNILAFTQTTLGLAPFVSFESSKGRKLKAAASMLPLTTKVDKNT